MLAKIKLNKVPPSTLFFILELFTRKQLRTLAKSYNIPRGKNKPDTVLSIYFNREKLKQSLYLIIVEIERKSHARQE